MVYASRLFLPSPLPYLKYLHTCGNALTQSESTPLSPRLPKGAQEVPCREGHVRRRCQEVPQDRPRVLHEHRLERYGLVAVFQGRE